MHLLIWIFLMRTVSLLQQSCHPLSHSLCPLLNMGQQLSQNCLLIILKRHCQMSFCFLVIYVMQFFDTSVISKNTSVIVAKLVTGLTENVMSQDVYALSITKHS